MSAPAVQILECPVCNRKARLGPDGRFAYHDRTPPLRMLCRGSKLTLEEARAKAREDAT